MSITTVIAGYIPKSFIDLNLIWKPQLDLNPQLTVSVMSNIIFVAVLYKNAASNNHEIFEQFA